MTDMLPVRSSRLWRIFAILAVLAVLVSGGVWLYARLTVDRLTERWVRIQAEHGVTATLPAGLAGVGSALGGFPLAVHRPLDHPQLAGPGWQFAAESAEIVYDLRRPRELAIDLTGAATLSLSPAADQPAQKLTLDAGSRVQFSLDQRGLAGGGGALPMEAVATLKGAAWHGGDGWIWGAKSGEATLRLPEAVPADHTQPGLTVGLQLSGVNLPSALQSNAASANAGAANAGAADAADLNAELAVMGLPPGPKPAALEAWRVDGGTVELRQASLVLGNMVMDLDGTFALDRGLQPIGAGTVKVAGADALEERLGSSGLMASASPKDVKKVRQAVKLLVQPDPNGGPATLNLPYTVQERRLFLGPFPVAKLPVFNW